MRVIVHCPAVPSLILATSFLTNLPRPTSAEEPSIVLGDMIRAPALPAGYETQVRDIKASTPQGEAANGKMIIVLSQEKLAQERVAGVVITREDRVLPTNPHKITAYKAYINTSNKGMDRPRLSRSQKRTAGHRNDRSRQRNSSPDFLRARCRKIGNRAPGSLHRPRFPHRSYGRP
jgi:hypothetical protein